MTTATLLAPALEIDGLDEYIALVRRFPVRRLKSDAEHAEALAVARELMRQVSPALTETEEDYLNALATFIQEYERKRHSFFNEEVTGLDFLLDAMKHKGTDPAELDAVLGVDAAFAILTGHRRVLREEATRLGEFFGEDLAYFL